MLTFQDIEGTFNNGEINAISGALTRLGMMKPMVNSKLLQRKNDLPDARRLENRQKGN